MTARGRKAGLLAVGLVAAALAFASVSWACTAQVGIAPLAQLAGPPGSKVTVTGSADRSGPVEIRWNGVKGPLLGTAVANQGDHGTSFATEITIPEAAPGVYYLVLVPGDAAVGVGRAAFEVLSLPSSQVGQPAGSAATRTTEGLWSDFSGSGEPAAPVGSTPAFTAGIVLLGVGLVGLVAGFGAAAVRRRSRVALGRSRSDSTA